MSDFLTSDLVEQNLLKAKNEGKKFGLGDFNEVCIAQVASTILALLGIPEEKINPSEPDMAPLIKSVVDSAQKKFGMDESSLVCAPCDRIVMYNPDAIAYWIFGRYYQKHFASLARDVDLIYPMLSVFPPKTPVCFASMYTGFMPETHGIKKYEKPVLKCTTLFDRLISAGKKIAIVSTAGDSISLIFLERKMDYFIYKTVAECNEKASELIKNDEYDVIVLYNTDYDYWMHRNTPTGLVAQSALKQDIREYTALRKLIKEEWGSTSDKQSATDKQSVADKGAKHRTALAFAPDHGCHRWYGVLGQHELNEPCDMNTVHMWSFIN